MNIVDQKYWNESYKNFEFYVENDSCTKLMEKFNSKYFSCEKLNSFFEFGCFPGRYFAFLGKLTNYEANGVDITPELNDNFYNWLKSEKVKVGKIENDDAFKYANYLYSKGKKFDVVYSVGFIEHFTNYLDVIDDHIKLVSDNGYLLIFTPNFRGVYQRLLHKTLDNPNYKNHVIESMNPKKWAKHIKSKGFDILESGYTGGFDFWVDKVSDNSVKKFFTKANYFLAAHNHLPNCRVYSPYCYILAKKK